MEQGERQLLMFQAIRVLLAGMPDVTPHDMMVVMGRLIGLWMADGSIPDTEYTDSIDTLNKAMSEAFDTLSKKEEQHEGDSPGG